MASSLLLRNELASKLGKSFGGKRKLYDVFGYPKQLTAEDFYNMYLRNDIAQRIIKAYPQATWRDKPNVVDKEGDETNEAFTEVFEDLYDEFQLANYFERADRLSGIGHFGLLLLGFQDGEELTQPLESGDHNLLYVQPYGEYNVTSIKMNDNPRSERYRLPEQYTIQAGNPMLGKTTKGQSIKVHHSRVIHIAEMLDEDEIYGVPRMMAIFNRLKDLEKVVGGSAEMFWLAANRGLAFKADADADLDDADDLKEQAEEYMHELRRFLTMQGVDVESLGSDTADPSSNVKVIVDLISGTTGIPKRILLGNEAGELASSQDETNWNARVDERRNTFAAPKIMRPFIDKMIMTGNLPEPKGEVDIEWDEADALSESEIADIDKKRAETVDRLDRVGFPFEELVKVFFPNKTEEEVKDIINQSREERPERQPMQP